MRMPAYDVWHPVFMLENCEDDAECFVRPFRNLSRVTFTPDGRGNYWLTKKLFVDCDMELNKYASNLIKRNAIELIIKIFKIFWYG